MFVPKYLRRVMRAGCPAILALAAFQALGSEIWNGPSLTFVRPSGVDWMQASNQDRLTPSVWLVRDTTRGLFNATQETLYEHYFSPANTEWAYGNLANFSSLTYTNWEGWNGHNPPSMVGRDAVLHLILDDIYLSIKFTSWGGPGGAYSYERSTPSVPEPSAGLLLGAVTAVAVAMQVRPRLLAHQLQHCPAHGRNARPYGRLRQRRPEG